MEPTILTADDLVASRQDRRPLTPEQRLYFAVLIEALQTYSFHKGKSHKHSVRLFKEADHWIQAHDYEHSVSFVNVCAILGLDPGYIRRGLARGGTINIQQQRMNSGLYARENRMAVKARVLSQYPGFRHNPAQAA